MTVPMALLDAASWDDKETFDKLDKPRWERFQNLHMKDVNYELACNGYILSSGSPRDAVYYKHKAGLDRRRTLVISLEDERLVSLEVQIEFTNPVDPWKPKIYNRKII